jgi:hypothetical protein
MTALATLQAQLQAAVRDGAEVPGLLKGPARGLQAYRIAYPARLLEALQDNYGVLHQALGDGPFAALADAYLQAHPPTEPSIRWFGHALPAFMDSWDGLPHPALADLARLDWTVRATFDAADAPNLSAAQLAATPPECWGGLPLQLQPHVHVLSLAWAVGPAWHALAEARNSGTEAELPAPAPLAHTVLVWRDDLRPQWRSLSAAEGTALMALAEQRTNLAAWLTDQGETALPQAVAWLQAWCADGLLQA